MACEISGSSYLSCSHWFMLHTYAHRQLKLLLVNDFTGICSAVTMNGPGMWALNLGFKLGHMKVAAFLNLFNKPKALVTQSSNLIFLSGSALVLILLRGSRCISARGFSGTF